MHFFFFFFFSAFSLSCIFVSIEKARKLTCNAETDTRFSNILSFPQLQKGSKICKGTGSLSKRRNYKDYKQSKAWQPSTWSLEKWTTSVFALMVPDHTTCTCRYLNKSLQQCHVQTSNEINENTTRVLQPTHATYTQFLQ